MVSFIRLISICSMGFLAACFGPQKPEVILSPNQIFVKPGDTLSGLAYKHGVPTRALSRANQLKAPYIIRPWQVLSLPRASDIEAKKRSSALSAPPIASPPILNAELSAEVNQEKRARSAGRQVSQFPQATPPVRATPLPLQTPKTEPKSPPKNQRPFIWPLKGRLLQPFSSGQKGSVRSDGIRISAPAGRTVCATQGGQVIYIGRDVPDMGNLILIRHAKGWVSAYGHVKNTVKAGENVQQGQTLGTVEKELKQPQLYFEIRKEGAKPVDPIQHLGSPQ